MKKYIIFLLFTCTATLVYAQEVSVIVQPVVCTSRSANGNVLVSSVPTAGAKDGKNHYQIGSFVYTPESFPTGIETPSSEIKQYPLYNPESDSFIIPAFPVKSVISLYSVEGKLLQRIQPTGENITLDANALPTITILRIINGEYSYSFKLMKQK